MTQHHLFQAFTFHIGIGLLLLFSSFLSSFSLAVTTETSFLLSSLFYFFQFVNVVNQCRCDCSWSLTASIRYDTHSLTHAVQGTHRSVHCPVSAAWTITAAVSEVKRQAVLYLLLLSYVISKMVGHTHSVSHCHTLQTTHNSTARNMYNIYISIYMNVTDSNAGCVSAHALHQRKKCVTGNWYHLQHTLYWRANVGRSHSIRSSFGPDGAAVTHTAKHSHYSFLCRSIGALSPRSPALDQQVISFLHYTSMAAGIVCLFCFCFRVPNKKE